MVAVRSDEADSILSRPLSEIAVFLIFGPDAGHVAERIRAALKQAGANADDPFQMVRIDSAELASDPGLLLNETNTVSLFGSSRIFRISAGPADITPAVEMALQNPGRDWKIVIDAGALKRDSAIRKFCERYKFALAIECNQDSEADLAKLLDLELAGAGMSLNAEAKSAILRLLGADRLSTRSEIAKLLMFAHGSQSLNVDDIESILADASAVAVEKTVNFAFAGNLEGVDETWRRVTASGPDASTILSTSVREAASLQQYCSDVERGGSPDGAAQRYLRTAFGRKPLSRDQLKRWTNQKSLKALAIVVEALRQSRWEPALGPELAIRALWSVSLLVKN